jgi:hypothetical protein
VQDVLRLEHLVEEESLAYGTSQSGGMGWDLAVTGKASATLTARNWEGQVVREVMIRDIGRNETVQTVP